MHAVLKRCRRTGPSCASAQAAECAGLLPPPPKNHRVQPCLHDGVQLLTCGTLCPGSALCNLLLLRVALL